MIIFIVVIIAVSLGLIYLTDNMINQIIKDWTNNLKMGDENE